MALFGPEAFQAQQELINFRRTHDCRTAAQQLAAAAIAPQQYSSIEAQARHIEEAVLPKLAEIGILGRDASGMTFGPDAPSSDPYRL